MSLDVSPSLGGLHILEHSSRFRRWEENVPKWGNGSNDSLSYLLGHLEHCSSPDGEEGQGEGAHSQLPQIPGRGNAPRPGSMGKKRKSQCQVVDAAQVLGKSSSHQGTPEHPCIWAGDGWVFRGEGAADVNAMPRRKASQPAPLQPVHPQRGSEACWLSLSVPSLMHEGTGPDGSVLPGLAGTPGQTLGRGQRGPGPRVGGTKGCSAQP